MIFFFIYILISAYFFKEHIIAPGNLPPFGAILFILLCLFLSGFILYSWIPFAFDIRIESKEKTIVFKNIITRHTYSYSFNDFDCYLETHVNSTYHDYKVVYLIKNGKAEKIITGRYYSNLDEMIEAISSIKYAGFTPKWMALSKKALFNQNIIEDKKES